MAPCLEINHLTVQYSFEIETHWKLKKKNMQKFASDS